MAKVLITRPEGQADGLADAVTAAGFEAKVVPVMAIDALTEQQLRPAINGVLDLDNYQHIIFISTNAVRYGMGLVDQYWPQWPERVRWHAIGKATAEALQRFDIDAELNGESNNSEALLANPSLQQLSGQKVLIFRGQGGREHLAEVLRQRGAAVDYAEVYCRRAAIENRESLQQALAESVDVIVAASADSVKNLLQLAEKQSILEIPLVVPSARVAMIATTAGFVRVLIAANAGSAAVIAQLQLHVSGQAND
ncbi:Uroporphyrinogen-III synthase [Sinobacterium norvegicum]|uniref:Uroporphyrinogen-III synthase n=1 Tax=Sinobacterium norvegicum TaxID=1641715 RepID=A0ABM9AFP8_9GAMM|nr:Uroporphyrinogen-III synthase [Sinobacterium norvegicum]